MYIYVHLQRESIVKIVSLQTKATFCYAIISKFGKVGVYDGKFNLLDSYVINFKPDTITPQPYSSQ